MRNDITQFDWDSLLSEDVHSSMENFLAQLNSFYQRNFPLKTKLVLVRNCNNPWVTPEISKLLEYKNTLFNLLRREVISIEENNVFKNKVQRVLRKSKENYYKTSFARAKGDLKKTWELIKSLTGKEETRDAIIQIIDGTNQITDEKTMAETFNIFFNNIASNLTQNLPQCNINPLSDINRNNHSMYVSPVTVEEISKIILSLKPKKSHIDTCGIAILKKICTLIALPLCKIINSSFQLGVFPKCLKLATITPLFKAGDRTNVTNYRPISILSPFSKIFEKLMLDRLWKFLNRFDIISNQQFGFMKGRSTEKAIISLTEYLYDKLNSNHHSLAVYIDFKKAFDTIDHKILLAKLERYGIRGMILSWFRSFLEDREHAVKLNHNCTSPYKKINIGVPQGSQLAPVLFLLFINDLPNFSSSALSIMFADDTTLCFSGNNLDDLISLCNVELSKFLLWSQSNKLSINVDKTNCMLFSNRIGSSVPPSVFIGDTPLGYRSSVKFLGVVLDNKLNFSEHLKFISNKLSKSVGILSNIKTLVPNEILQNLYYNLIFPYLNYCTIVWGGTYATHLHPVEIIQKKAIRIINRRPFRDHTNPLFLNSKILKVNDIFKFRVCEYFYANNLSAQFSRNHEHHTRNRETLIPDFQRLTSTQRSISFVGPSFWNSIPNEIRNSRSRSIFKNRLKNFLISSYNANLII